MEPVDAIEQLVKQMRSESAWQRRWDLADEILVLLKYLREHPEEMLPDDVAEVINSRPW